MTASRSTRRRTFLASVAAGIASLAATPAGATPAPDAAVPLHAGGMPVAPAGTPETVARDERYWSAVRAAFDLDPGVVQLWHGPGGAVPRTIVATANALTADNAREMGLLPAFAGLEESGSSAALRAKLAATFGCGADEIALTRNAMEGLATALLGVDLLRGDEIVSTVYDYDSCLAILRQREAREGVRLRLARIPAPASDANAVVDAIEAEITPRTRLVLVCHILTHTGQVLPIREIASMTRRRGVFLVVDGAHGPGHLPLALDDVGCDAYAASLHKWFSAPRGTGMLFVRRERIAAVWPLFAPYDAPSREGIDKFQQVGTVSLAGPAVLPSVCAAYAAIGAANKEARLRYLRDRWATPLARFERVKFLTDFDPRWSSALVGFRIEGVDRKTLRQSLREHGFAIGTFQEREVPSLTGFTVGANVTNSLDEIDRFVETLIGLARLR